MNEKFLTTIRHAVRDKKKVATVLGFGPRFCIPRDKPTKAAPIARFLADYLRRRQESSRPGQKFTFRYSPRQRKLAAISPFSPSAPPRFARPLGEESEVGLAL